MEQLPKLHEIFFPHDAKETARILSGDHYLVHYTDLEALRGILSNRTVWMRNAQCMNDYSEVRYGTDLHREPFRNILTPVLDELFPGMANEIGILFDQWVPSFVIHTFITCLSEYNLYSQDDEDKYGRLSMWRAYTKTAGIALVMKAINIANIRTDELKIYSIPVAYFDKDQAFEHAKQIALNIQNNKQYLLQLGRELIKANMFRALRFAIVSTKHPGFREEKEWRVIHNPEIEPSTYIQNEIVTINGMSQRVFKIPLKNNPSIGFSGIEIPQLIDRVIIGPTQYPLIVHDTVTQLLKDAGVEKPKIIFSGIPLRNG